MAQRSLHLLKLAETALNSTGSVQEFFRLPVPGNLCPFYLSYLQMKTLKVLTVWGCTLLAANNSGYAQPLRWQQLNGPWGGQFTSIITVGDWLVASSHDNGIYRSSDHGLSWVQSDTSHTGYISAGSFAVQGSLLLAGADYVYASTDTGATWRQLGTSSAMISRLQSIGGVVLGGGGADIWRSEDAFHWHLVSQSIDDVHAFLQDSIWTFAASSFGIYRSTDTGITWTQLSVDDRFRLSFETICKIHNTLLAAEYYGAVESKLYRSTDRGNSWKAVSKSPYGVLCFAQTNSAILAGTADGGLFRSTDEGLTWTPIFTGEPNDVCSQFATLGNEIFLTTGTNGALCSTDEGITWEQKSQGLRRLSGTSIFKNDSILLTSGNGIYSSPDNGDHWSIAGRGLGRVERAAFAQIGDRIIAVVGIDSGIYYSDDNARSWLRSKMNGRLDGGGAFAVGVGEGYIIAGGIGMYRSTERL
jgi:photosystem II stability/assembly factor-like uncharacterized protein